jgi:hypothetical protein
MAVSLVNDGPVTIWMDTDQPYQLNGLPGVRLVITSPQSISA